IFAIVVGAMTGGWATPTEAAAVGAAATILAAACYRALTSANLMKALTGTVAVSGTILFIILGATTFSQVLSFSGATNGIQGVAPPSITMQQVYAASVPYIVFGVLVLIAIFFVPAIATWLPALLGG